MFHARQRGSLLNNLRDIRKKLKISQEELAQSLHKTKSYISKIENGKVDPPFKMAFLITESLKQIYLENTGPYLELQINQVFKIEEKM
ncbi:helix-turn-helix transcriptional regulator [Aneurinibacillus sp. Ricciae_BoGa-3]|nr:helix-turn-helix transcriptional regulator [Aneurinibacillus sp. Ricciae_BoGa-3]WCK56825.1 helix-turn-helix transcriptional regulator [Aneurinibacillus sp. Ricciae_BoGa-3]